MTLSLEASPLDFSQMGGSSSPTRSPRTPTYAPNSPSLANISPFDPFELYSVSPVSPTNRMTLTKRKPRAPPPPPKLPMAWTWQCHLCNSRWRLGTTRRCLVDGHYYCSGQPQRNVKGKKKGQACSSEFDYVGWKRWGEWKLKAWRAMDESKELGSCETCVYPSECRHNRPGHVLPPTVFKGTKPENKKETYTFANRGATQNREGTDESASRYYSPERASSHESKFTKMFEDGDNSASVSGSAGSGQSKVTDFYKPGRNVHGGPVTRNQSKKNAFSKISSDLDSIMEEPISPSSKGSATQSRSDFIMPVLDDWLLSDEEL